MRGLHPKAGGYVNIFFLCLLGKTLSERLKRPSYLTEWGISSHFFMANSTSFIIPTSYLLILACNKARSTLWGQWGRSLNITRQSRSILTANVFEVQKEGAFLLCCGSGSINENTMSFLCMLLPSHFLQPPQTHIPQHTKALYHLQRERKTALITLPQLLPLSPWPHLSPATSSWNAWSCPAGKLYWLSWRVRAFGALCCCLEDQLPSGGHM